MLGNAQYRTWCHFSRAVRPSLCISCTCFHTCRSEPLEWGGTAEPAKEREFLAEEKAHFITEAERTAQPTVDQARRILNRVGGSEHAIETQFYPSVATADIVDDILEVARQGSFGTIVVVRGYWPRLKEAFGQNICHELIKKARSVTVWVVE